MLVFALCTRNSECFLVARVTDKEVGFDFVTMVTRWSRSTSDFYVLIGQKLTGEFMRNIYAAS